MADWPTTLGEACKKMQSGKLFRPLLFRKMDGSANRLRVLPSYQIFALSGEVRALIPLFLGLGITPVYLSIFLSVCSMFPFPE